MKTHIPEELWHRWQVEPREITMEEAIRHSIQNLQKHKDRLSEHDLEFIKIINEMAEQKKELEAQLGEVENIFKERVEVQAKKFEQRFAELEAQIETREVQIQNLEIQKRIHKARLEELEAQREEQLEQLRELATQAQVQETRLRELETRVQDNNLTSEPLRETLYVLEFASMIKSAEQMAEAARNMRRLLQEEREYPEQNQQNQSESQD